MKTKHQNNNGKNEGAAYRRGRPPHKGGYHAAQGDDKKCYPNSWFERKPDAGVNTKPIR